MDSALAAKVLVGISAASFLTIAVLSLLHAAEWVFIPFIIVAFTTGIAAFLAWGR